MTADTDSPDSDPSQTRTVGDLTNRELKLKIAARTGYRPASQLTKPMLNSLFAWLTGEFFVKPAMLGPGTPPREDLVTLIASEVRLEDYLQEHHRTDRRQPRPFNQRELRSIVVEMNRRGDQRHWTQGGD